MSAVTVDIDDLRLVLGELGRTSKPTAGVVAAMNRLREALSPGLFGDTLSDPGADIEGAHHGRETERAAAWAAMPKSGTHRLRALAAIALAGSDGLTDHDLAERTGIYLYTVAPRRVELMKGGWVRDSGHRRETPNGQSAVVWILTEEGAARLAQQKENTDA